MSSSPIDVVLEFERAINSRSAASVAAMLTPNSALIDSLGTRVQGRDKLRAGWEGYYRMVPDYLISHEEVFADGNTVAMFGSAQGTYSQDGTLEQENFWKCPAAWRAVVEDGKIAVWQVYADNEPIRAIMRKNK